MSTEPISNTDSLTSTRAFAAARQRARRGRLKREGLLSLRLNVTAAEAAALKALLHDLRQTKPAQEPQEAPELLTQPAPAVKEVSGAPVATAAAISTPTAASQGTDLATLRRLHREKREREAAAETQKQQVRANIMARLKVNSRAR